MPTAEAPAPGLWESLKRPAAVFPLTAARLRRGEVPWVAAAVLAGIAVGGSCLYGASLALWLPGVDPGRAALWLALSAGLAWCVLGPLLIRVSVRSPWVCAHACLVSMAWGEAVLASASLLNLCLWLAEAAPAVALGLNGLCLLGTNALMAGVLAAQLRTVGVPARSTLMAWLVGLNASGAVFAWLFWPLVR